MILLISGLLLWSVVHFIPSAAADIKQKWVESIGAKGYTLSFSLLILLSVALVVIGWRSVAPSHLYTLPELVKPFSLALMVLAFLLLGAARQPTRIRLFIRHPQLTGLVLWSVAHLLLNGDSRSALLFGWLCIWAVIEIHLINKRDGKWIKEAVPGWGREIAGVAVSLTVFIAVATIHPYIAGVPAR